MVIFGSDDGNVYAVSSINQQLLWNYSTDSFISSGLDAGDNTVYFGSQKGRLFAVDTTTGKIRWSTPLGDPNSTKVYAPALYNGVVYVGAQDGKLYAVDATGGYVLWSYQMGGAAVAKPLCRPGYVYVGSQDGYAYAINMTTGELAWKLRTDGPVKATPGFGAGGLGAGVIYVASEDGNVYAVDAQFGGLPYWQYNTSKVLDSTPVVAGDHLYVAALDGTIYSFRLPQHLVLSTAAPTPVPTSNSVVSATPKPTPTLVPLPSQSPSATPISPLAGLGGLVIAVLFLARRRR
jgi:outer membrane protein assembly factor BamB